MKKTIGLVGIGLFFVSMVFAGCASMTPGQKTIVTKENLSTVKGTWQGWTTFSSVLVRTMFLSISDFSHLLTREVGEPLC